MTHRRLDVVHERFFPAYVVWELTLACDQACLHCGSRAGSARANELQSDEAIRVARELAELGAREVVLIGGEAYLHPGFFQVVRALSESGVVTQITTGGRGVTPELARDLARAGLAAASVSLDGLEATHDTLRASPGSQRAALSALHSLRAAGIRIGANTNLNRRNRDELEALFELVCEHGVESWQIQLTAPLGRAADRTQLVLQPYDLLDLVPRIARVKERARARGVHVMPGNNLGYFGPEEARLRSWHPGGKDHFAGCQAGRFVLGIESHGEVKGCPSLQSPEYIVGSLRDTGLAELWRSEPRLAFRRDSRAIALTGFCASCPFGATCLGGCTFTAHALLGAPGDNPYCHYRARDFAKRGLRERLVPTEPARGEPFDSGRFRLLVEPLDAPEPELSRAARVQVTRPAVRRA
ncbi:MAG: radical SAM protein [Polyangiaceae bacterium]